MQVQNTKNPCKKDFGVATPHRFYVYGDMEIGDRINKLLTDLEKSQSWLARQTGIDQSAISRVVSGKQRLFADQLGAIADAFKVSADEILGRKTIPPAIPGDMQTVLDIIEEIGTGDALKRLVRPPGPQFGHIEPKDQRTGTK